MLETLRLYETVRHTAVSASGPELLIRLGRTVGCALHVCDPQRGCSLIPGVAEPPRAVVLALARAVVERREPLPAVLRLSAAGRPFLALAVPASRPATLIASFEGHHAAPLDVLRHVAGVAALEVERVVVERERRRRLGSELLAGLVDGRLSAEAAEAAEAALDERGLCREPRLLAMCELRQTEEGRVDLHLRLEDRGLPHVLLRRSDRLLVLLADAPGALGALRAELGASDPVGLSDHLGPVSRAAEAQREARWALQAAMATGRPLVRYGEEAPSRFLPRGLGEAQRAVDDVIGPLLAHDEANDAELVHSLRTFLACNRSWKEAAAELTIHKQTLVYRMRRVEALTGRRLDYTGDVAELWLALRAAEWTGGPNLPPARRGVRAAPGAP